MLRRLTNAETEDFLRAFWPVALDLTCSGYPTYTDGIKTFGDFSNTVRKAMDAPWGEVLVHVHDGAANGLVVVEQVDEEYLSLPVCLARDRQRAMLTELLTHLACEYSGRILWLGFAPENAQRLAFAQENGFTLLDDSVNWQMKLTDWQQPMRAWQHSSSNVRSFAVDAESYPIFRGLWTDVSMYWNADRIAASLDRWRLFVCADDAGPLAAVACMKDTKMPEIFGFMYRGGYDAQAHQTLLSDCLNTAQRAGCTHLIYFAGAEEGSVMAAMGFERVSGYVCYEKHLKAGVSQ